MQNLQTIAKEISPKSNTRVTGHNTFKRPTFKKSHSQHLFRVEVGTESSEITTGRFVRRKSPSWNELDRPITGWLEKFTAHHNTRIEGVPVLSYISSKNIAYTHCRRTRQSPACTCGHMPPRGRHCGTLNLDHLHCVALARVLHIADLTLQLGSFVLEPGQGHRIEKKVEAAARHTSGGTYLEQMRVIQPSSPLKKISKGTD
ncbi:hypothetical protein JTE90_024794 [Oedothorax gibbosus]|uniref:Uncharacterized protein n=1 Tax=Oedothorax gibbosus TaxID=931172 RepID=A0AAV6TZ91_9ARAC|nr:hypothetical protein JTE90_024794 [Oedothorax gibbosus]